MAVNVLIAIDSTVFELQVKITRPVKRITALMPSTFSSPHSQKQFLRRYVKLCGSANPLRSPSLEDLIRHPVPTYDQAV